MDIGSLIVFEGPDGVGKTTLAGRFESYLTQHGTMSLSLSFPGKDLRTLGGLVDQIHHDPHRFEIEQLTPLSLQALHIAAHLDHIEARIVPALRAGRLVILDRFWWSTWVYGRVARVNTAILDTLIEAEKIAWSRWRPKAVFLVSRPEALRPEQSHAEFVRLNELYSELATQEASRHTVATITSDNVDAGLQVILDTLGSMRTSTC